MALKQKIEKSTKKLPKAAKMEKNIEKCADINIFTNTIPALISFTISSNIVRIGNFSSIVLNFEHLKLYWYFGFEF